MSEWISVEDRLPHNQQEVLYYFKHTGIHAGRYVDQGCFMGAGGYLVGDVTHWQPLPEPPKE